MAPTAVISALMRHNAVCVNIQGSEWQMHFFGIAVWICGSGNGDGDTHTLLLEIDYLLMPFSFPKQITKRGLVCVTAVRIRAFQIRRDGSTLQGMKRNVVRAPDAARTADDEVETGPHAVNRVPVTFM